jgi:hypothetical protein
MKQEAWYWIHVWGEAARARLRYRSATNASRFLTTRIDDGYAVATLAVTIVPCR